MPEPFFIHEGEIVIWTQNQNSYCQFRIVEGDTKECARLLLRTFELLEPYGLNWKWSHLTETYPIFFDSESLFLTFEEA